MFDEDWRFGPFGTEPFVELNLLEPWGCELPCEGKKRKVSEGAPPPLDSDFGVLGVLGVEVGVGVVASWHEKPPKKHFKSAKVKAPEEQVKKCKAPKPPKEPSAKASAKLSAKSSSGFTLSASPGKAELQERYVPGQPMQGSHKFSIVIGLEQRSPNEHFYAYSVKGDFALFQKGAVRTLCGRYKAALTRDNEFQPSDAWAWTITSHLSDEPCTLLENEMLNRATMGLEWCGFIQTEKRAFVFLAHTEYGFYCFMANAPNPARLILSCKKREPIRIQML